PAVFKKNLDRLLAIFSTVPEDVAVCRNAAEYRAAQKAGKHGAFIGIQGGNALDAEGALAEVDPTLLIKVTLVHLSTSTLGTTSMGGAADGRLTDRGRDYV